MKEQAESKAQLEGATSTALPLHVKMALGLCSGGIGSFVGTPSEVALVRMSADSKLPVNQRRNYKGIGDCLARIYQDEGLAGLWTGARVTVLRAMLLTACVLGIGSEIKERLAGTGWFGLHGKMFHGLPLLFVATICSSFFANIVTNPVDVVKSRMQNQAKGGGGNKQLEAAGRSDDIWLECDDETVQAITRRRFEEILSTKQGSSTPYLLFYQKI